MTQCGNNHESGRLWSIAYEGYEGIYGSAKSPKAASEGSGVFLRIEERNRII